MGLPIQNNEIVNKVYDFCKYVYSEEKKRSEFLNNRAKIYLTLQTFILGALFLKLELIDKIFNPINNYGILFVLDIFLYFLSLILFLIASIYTSLALRIMIFESLCNPKTDVLEKLNSKITEKDFFLN